MKKKKFGERVAAPLNAAALAKGLSARKNHTRARRFMRSVRRVA
jgi:hypothetical protein